MTKEYTELLISIYKTISKEGVFVLETYSKNEIEKYNFLIKSGYCQGAFTPMIDGNYELLISKITEKGIKFISNN